jgi:hypothetical protein
MKKPIGMDDRRDEELLKFFIDNFRPLTINLTTEPMVLHMQTLDWMASNIIEVVREFRDFEEGKDKWGGILKQIETLKDMDDDHLYKVVESNGDLTLDTELFTETLSNIGFDVLVIDENTKFENVDLDTGSLSSKTEE